MFTTAAEEAESLLRDAWLEDRDIDDQADHLAQRPSLGGRSIAFRKRSRHLDTKGAWRAGYLRRRSRLLGSVHLQAVRLLLMRCDE
jgi:hypothetical protein